MNCPLCIDQVLDERFSHGIEVDVCPNCKGVWLDRGELERLMAQSRIDDPTVLASSGHRVAQDGGSLPPTPVAVPERDEPKKQKPKKDKRDDWDDREKSSKKSKKKKSKKKRFSDLLEDVLDEVLDL